MFKLFSLALQYIVWSQYKRIIVRIVVSICVAIFLLFLLGDLKEFISTTLYILLKWGIIIVEFILLFVFFKLNMTSTKKLNSNLIIHKKTVETRMEKIIKKYSNVS